MTVLANATEPHGEHLTDDEIFAFLRLLLPAGAETTYRSSSNLLFGLLVPPRPARRGARPTGAVPAGHRGGHPLGAAAAAHHAHGRPRTSRCAACRCRRARCGHRQLGSANHDETRWDDPERFDIFRERKPHIGFAYGPHMCLGMHLARMETKVALEALFDRLPEPAPRSRRRRAVHRGQRRSGPRPASTSSGADARRGQDQSADASAAAERGVCAAGASRGRGRSPRRAAQPSSAVGPRARALDIERVGRDPGRRGQAGPGPRPQRASHGRRANSCGPLEADVDLRLAERWMLWSNVRGPVTDRTSAG